MLYRYLHFLNISDTNGIFTFFRAVVLNLILLSETNAKKQKNELKLLKASIITPTIFQNASKKGKTNFCILFTLKEVASIANNFSLGSMLN